MNRIRPNPSLVQVGLTTIIVIVIMTYLIISLNTGDLLWFVPNFDGLPTRILVHCYGQDVIINAGDPSYEAVNMAVNSSLSGSKRWDQLSLSDNTQAEYQTSPIMMVMELSYNPPARIHSYYKFYKNIDTLIIPLDGRHASTNTVFGLLQGNIDAGSFHVTTIKPILDALEQEGLCSKQQ